MASVTVKRTAVNQMIVARLLGELDGSGVRLYLFDEEPPDHSADKSGDTPVDRWCKVHRVAIGPRQNSSGADERSLSMTISVGVSPAALTANRHALSDAMQLVHEAIEHAAGTHSDGAHRLQMGEVQSDVVSAGRHDAHATGVISVVGSATRNNT